MIMRTIARVSVLLWIGVALTLPARAGLVGHWRFDEGNGTTINDSSGLGNHGVLINPKTDTWTDGMNAGSGALYLDGTTGAGSTFVTIPDAASLHISTAISFAAWIRCDDIARDAPILDKESDGKLSYWFGTFGSGGEGSSPGNFGVLLDLDGNQPWSIFDRNQGALFPGVWMHAASTWDGTIVRHYLNGVLLPQTAPFSGPLQVSDAPLIIGANVPYNNTAFKGAIDEARLYDHALSPAEVRALVGATPQLIGHWTFDEGNGTNILDSSGLGNHGLLINAATNTWTVGLSSAALYFDGTVGPDAAYVQVPDAPSLHIAAEVSFAAWVRCDDIARDAPILAKEGDGKLSYWFGAFGLTYHGSGPGNFGVLLSDNGNQPWTVEDRDQGAIAQGEWVHLAGTWDGTTIRHYLNGESLAQTGTFTGPIRFSDAFLAIGVNSLYTFAANRTAFKGAIDDVSLYNYALGPDDIRGLYQAAVFRITAVQPEGRDLRLTWSCIPGRSYVIQTSTLAEVGGRVEFADQTAPIQVPIDYIRLTFDFVHSNALANSSALFYRLKLLP